MAEVTKVYRQVVPNTNITRMFQQCRKEKVDYGSYFEHISYPTGNCQLSSIAYFNNALTYIYSKDEMLSTSNLFNLLHKIAGHGILLIDVKQTILVREEYKNFLKRFVKTRKTTKYISTNKSKMATVLLYLDLNAIRVERDKLKIKYNFLPTLYKK